VGHLRERGFDIYIHDHIGHGHSAGNQSHLFALIAGLEAVINHIERVHKIDAFIGHSAGSLAILNQRAELLAAARLILISPPTTFFEDMFAKIHQSGISGDLLLAILEDLSTQFGKSWKQLAMAEQKHKIHEKTLIIHDRNDRFCSFEESRKFFASSPASFFSTENLGHHRILASEDVGSIIADYLNF
jgi:predicted alpha/beta hydrolase family esterase